MLYIEKIENHKLGANTPLINVANSLGWTITRNEDEIEKSDVDGCLYEKGFAPMKTDEQKAQEEQERINELFLTRADVFKAILLAQNITRNDLKELITRNETVPMLQKELALIDFEEALNFYRKNPLIDIIGNSLGIDKIHLNNFFVKGNNEETKSEAWKELIVEPEPSEVANNEK